MIFPLQLQTIRIGKKNIELFVPDAAVVQRAYDDGLITFPYWSQLWPSSLALSEFILDHLHLIQNKNLLELGAGLGLPSLVASEYANTVISSDKDRDAVDIISKSAAYNHIKNLKAVFIDWNQLPETTDINVVMLSDINYEPVAFEKLKEIILRYINNGTTILLATPQRLMAKPFIEIFLQYCKKREELKVMHQNKVVPISILIFQA